MRKKLHILTTALTILMGVAVLFFMKDYADSIVPLQNTETEVLYIDTLIVDKKEAFGISLDDYNKTSATVKRNEFLANILLPHGVDYVIIDRIAKDSKEVFDVRKMAAGKNYHILKKKDSLESVAYFIYQINPIDYVVFDLRDSVKIYKDAKEVIQRTETISGSIQSSLYESLQKSNASPALAVEMADIFAWSIDFYRIQKGDSYKVVYTVNYVDEEPIGIDQILAIEFNHFKTPYYGLYFKQGDNEDYFDLDATSLRKAFLKSPLKFSRLSSRYTLRRFHPVQKRWKAHLGTDYAAPTGTPIMSTGDGVIIAASYTKGNGKYVKVKHNSVYSTQYLHMSRRNVKNGQHVKQGDIIGYVGSTGLATGPHVCYRFWKNGKQVDPYKQKFPSANPVKEEYLEEFEKQKKVYLNMLDAIDSDKNIIAQNPS